MSRWRFGSRPLWKRLIVALGLTGLVGAIVLAGLIVRLSIQASINSLSPPQIPADQTPSQYGIIQYEEVSIITDDGVRIAGWYIPPSADNQMVILMAHGYAHNRAMLLPEAEILSQQGYGALLFDFRGHGDSDSAQVTFGDQEQRDLTAAIDYVGSRPEVARIGAIGFSMGAAVVAEVAAEDSRLVAVVIEAAFPSLEQEIFYRANAFWLLSQVPAALVIRGSGVDVTGVRPIDKLCSISPRKVLLVYGANDQDVPPGTIDAMSENLCENGEAWIIPDAGHRNFTIDAPEEYSIRLTDFFDISNR